MLILSRHVGESIVIGDRLITFKILGLARNQVRIGITAAREIAVHREEVLQRIESSRRTAQSAANEPK